MARVGNEFGSVTGRQRRCGWLDLVALNMLSGKRCYAIDDDERRCAFRIRNFESLYRLQLQRRNSTLPITSNQEITPVYKNFKGWKADLTGMTTYEELPIELKEYIEFIEKK
jgi:adenylosuccinate synthase